MGALTLKLLGDLKILDEDGCLLKLRSRKATALLAFLAVCPGQLHGRDKLASLLWAECDDIAARRNLRQALFALRRALPDNVASDLEADGEAIALDVGTWDIDVASFRRLAETSDIAGLEEAANLYGGDFLDGLQVDEPIFDDWLTNEREQLREMARDVLSRLFEAKNDENESHAAISAGLRLLALDPLQESVHRALMTRYARAGRRDAALRQYEICRRTLELELGVEPEVETARLYEEILHARTTEPPNEGDDAGAMSALPTDRDVTPVENGVVPPASAAPPYRRAAIGLGLISFFALILVSAYWRSDEKSIADSGSAAQVEYQTGPSIAVLPFVNMSGDPEQDYFADGMTEQLISELARFRDLFVIARNSVFQYRGQSVDVRDVARELGVRYVVEGSIRRDEEAVRVTVQLIDAATGGHLWSEEYDGQVEVNSMFDIQDTVAEQVVGVLGANFGVVSRTEQWRARQSRPENLSAYYCVLKAHEFVLDYTFENHKVARDCLKEAVVLEPDYAEAWAWLGWIYIYGYADDLDEVGNYRTLGREAARRATALDPANQMAHYVMALSHFFHQNVPAFREESAVAISLNPNNAFVVGDLAVNLSFTGEWERGRELLRGAMARNPIFPRYWWYAIAKGHLAQHEYGEAVTALNKVDQPDFWIYQLASAYMNAHAGRLGQAKQAIATLLTQKPDITIPDGAALYARYNFEPSFVSLVVDGLRLAGLPEGPPEES